MHQILNSIFYAIFCFFIFARVKMYTFPIIIHMIDPMYDIKLLKDIHCMYVSYKMHTKTIYVCSQYKKIYSTKKRKEIIL